MQEVATDLLDAIRAVPVARDVEHCGIRFEVSPFAIYATCPRCGERVKVRAFSAGAEVEDVFDAVFEWMNQPGAQDLARRRWEALREDDEAAGGGPFLVTESRWGRNIEPD